MYRMKIHNTEVSTVFCTRSYRLFLEMNVIKASQDYLLMRIGTRNIFGAVNDINMPLHKFIYKDYFKAMHIF